LSGFVRKDGRSSGILMIDDSNKRLQEACSSESAVNEEHFIDKMEALTIKASGKDYFMEHLGTYISHICDVAAEHHVMMNPAFITAALAVKVQEGIALALDPGTSRSQRVAQLLGKLTIWWSISAAEIWRVATPIILESESKRGMSKLTFHRLQEQINVLLGTKFGVEKE
jgi:predicted unusual protein kinase regulating ubiquinone biosynthesis (AarF/ABC1/UbiB family)